MGGHVPADAPALVASAADAIYLVDEQGRVQYANPAALEVLGYEHESELLGRPSHQTIHHSRPDGSPFPEEQCPLLEPRRTGDAVRNDDDWFIRRDGTFVPVAYSSAPVQTPTGRGAVVVFHDTSERIAVEQAQREAEVERARAEDLRESRARIVAATHEERRRLGRDLHDGAQQHLVNVSVALQLLSAGSAEPESTRLVTQALEETRAAIEDLRELAAGLVPSVLLHRGLRGAVESLTSRAPLPVTLEVDDARVHPLIEAAAYFFVAEALTNVAKHARAESAVVRTRIEHGELTVEVEDDGVGGAAPLGGSGLRGLEDRLQALDGALEITVPRSGPGTLLRATLPISSPAIT